MLSRQANNKFRHEVRTVESFGPIKRASSGLTLSDFVQANDGEGVMSRAQTLAAKRCTAGLSYKPSELGAAVLRGADVLALVYDE
ncbi:10 kDa chaperonin [Candidatus Hodgkinia cicadicola]|nr:10 kDa chaperonin [Candidatus Hodgkinia cicadicola]